MPESIRTERRFGVTAQLTQEQRKGIMSIRNSREWQDILDVMEMVCVETEARLINTLPENEPEVLANHKMAQAAWQIFTHMQEKIDIEISLYMNSLSKQPHVPDLTDEEREQENILDPTRHYGQRENEENYQ